MILSTQIMLVKGNFFSVIFLPGYAQIKPGNPTEWKMDALSCLKLMAGLEHLSDTPFVSEYD